MFSTKIHIDGGGGNSVCPMLSAEMLSISKQIKSNPLYAKSWKEIKKNYQKDAVKNTKYMEDMIQKRNDLVKLVQKEYCDECIFNISGSTSLTSDIDITVQNKSESTNHHLFAFDEIETMIDVMKCLLDNESLITLDVNFYGHSYYFKENLSGVCTKSNNVENEYYLNLDEDFERKYRFGEAFALLKVKKYYQEMVDSKTKKKWNLNFKDCENIMKKFKTYSESNDTTNLYMYVNNDQDVTKKNKMYLKQLKYIDDLSHHSKQTAGKKSLRYRLISEISHASVYSDESYFSYGAFMHVVYGEQMKRDISKLSKLVYIQSMLENFGDVLKVYNEYPDDVFSKGSKYIVRIYSSLKMLVRNHRNSEILSKFLKVRELYKVNPKDEVIKTIVKDSKITLDEVMSEVYKVYKGSLSSLKKKTSRSVRRSGSKKVKRTRKKSDFKRKKSQKK